ncbi:MAG TPA: hypothetical protein VJA85_01395 [Candidatus Limnocylindria bacterium]|nr:hypothetical protein [Candidatus Limnocylindria bacterium]
MAYMVMQRTTTAVREAYAGRADVAEQHTRARECRAWLESLAIQPALRAELVEPIRAVEEALADVLRAPAAYRRRSPSA